MKTKTSRFIRVSSLFSILLLIPSFAFAQMGGYGMGMGMGGYGMGMGMGGYGMGGGYGGMDGGPAAVATVKYGEKIYDAIYDDLVDYNVYYIQVPADTIGVHYFDDGREGDEVPYDGMPSNITINRNTYLGPFTIKYKKMLNRAVQEAREMGVLEFYNLKVMTESPESRVQKKADWNMRMEGFIEDFRSQRLEQFEGYDDETYIKSIDPSLFESLEGYGGVGGGGGFGAGGYLPDLPPPPGLPNPLEQGFQTEDGALGGGGDFGGGETTQPQRFNPIQRTTDTLDDAGLSTQP